MKMIRTAFNFFLLLHLLFPKALIAQSNSIDINGDGRLTYH